MFSEKSNGIFLTLTETFFFSFEKILFAVFVHVFFSRKMKALKFAVQN